MNTKKLILEVPDSYKTNGFLTMTRHEMTMALSLAVEAVEVKAIKTGEGYIACGITGRAVTLFAVAVKEGKV